MALLWRYGLFAGFLLALGVWHLADKSRAVDDAVELVRAEYITAALAASESARAKERALNLSVERAKDDALKREKILLADADRADATAGRLRDDITRIRASLPGLTDAAVRRYADAASIVFNQCVNEYRDMAAQADQLANDRQTLIDAWPRE